MSQTHRFEFVNDRGQKLSACQYAPESGNVIARLIWHHGLGEHCGRYQHVFSQLAAAGIAVYSYDAFGHGQSEPADPNQRCLIWKFQQLVDDLLLFAKVVHDRGGDNEAVPRFLGGQSMGALVAAHAAIQKPGHWVGLILHSAAIDVNWTPVLRAQAAVGNLLATVIPRQQIVPAVRPEDLSSDPEVLQNFLSDSLIFHGNVRARTANELLKGFKALRGQEKQLTLPILAVHGDTDRTTSLAALERFCQSVSSTDVNVTKIAGGYHELLMGGDQKENVGRLVDWMTARVQPAEEPLTNA
eukprot:jgi/Chrzof1/12353/Cz06g31170.t1